MRPSSLGAIIALSFSTAAFALDPMPITSGNMGKPMMEKPMPDKVEDNRQVVPLTEAERAIVAAEMRQMLASIQSVVDGLARGDKQAVVNAASKSGMAMMHDVPSPIRMKFPEPFVQLGMASHRAFDQIARDAKTAKGSGPILKLLAEASRNCVACHATYRFAPPK